MSAQPDPKCVTCGTPVSYETGFALAGGLGDSSQDRVFCPACAPDQGTGYTLADLQRMGEGDELGPGLHKVGPEPYAYVFNPAEGQRITAVNVDGRSYTGVVTHVDENKKTGEIVLTVQPESEEPS